MSSSQSSYEFKGDSTSVRVTPVTSYDPFEAKFCASLFWLVLMKTQDGNLENMPPQVTCPIERDAEQRITVRPEIIELLTNGDVYNSVCNSIFDNKQPIVGHWAVIQCLSRNGFYVVEDGDIPVTDSTLQQKKPFRKSTHLALMDGLMSAYSSKVVTIPQVVQAVRRFAPFNASKELPFDLEDALLLWLNKVCSTLNDKEISKQKRHAENLLRDQDKAKRFRFRRDQLHPKAQTLFPIVDDLLKGISDGQCLLGIVLFYHTDSVKLEDIKFGQDLSQGDIVHNIELFRSLCSQYVCTTSLSLQVEDFMYSSHAMKPNLVALLAEMFYKCELEDDTLTTDKKVRSKSATNITGFTNTDNVCNTRSSSAPMLASEIIAARSPSVGRKLKDFAKEKNQQRCNQQVEYGVDEEKITKNSSQEKQNTAGSNKTTRSYSLQLDFTDEDEGIEDTKDKENPFSGIYQKPVLLNRKHSAPEPSPLGVSKGEPNLNRRSKQKPRTLALDDWEMDEKDAIDFQVTDLQRSHSLTELDNKIVEPRKSFHAWHDQTSSSDPSLDQNTMKSQRISLDFKPMKSIDRDIVIRPSLQRSERNHDDRVSQDSLLSSSPRSVDSLSSKQPRGLKQKENPVTQSTISEQELKEFEEMEAIVLAQRSYDFNLNKSNDINDEDGLNTSVSSDDMNRFRLEVLQRLTADKIKSLEMQSDQDANKVDGEVNSCQSAESRPDTNQEGLNVPDERPEELLSPINESSEPLHSTGSLPGTHSSTPSTAPSSPCSPLDVAPFTPEFFMTSPANTIDKKAYKKAAASKQRQKDSSKNQSSLLEVMPSATPRLEDMNNPPRNRSVELLARGSYTMDQISIDAAKAAGIPVIGSDIELRNTPNQMRLSRTTLRSLSVPLDNDPILHKRSMQDRPPSSSLSHASLVIDDQIPLHERGVNSGSYPIVSDLGQDGRYFSSQQFEDVVIFDRQTSDIHQAVAPSNIGLPYTRDQSYHEPRPSSFVGRSNTNEGTDLNSYDGVNRHSFYGQKFVNQHDIDGSRSPRNHDPFREYITRTSHIPTNTNNIRSYSNIPASNELVNQSIRTSNQEMNSRYNNANNSPAMSSRPDLHSFESGGWGTNQESRVVYNDQYGTYVKNRTTDPGYHGSIDTVTSMYYQDAQDQSSPRYTNTQGQFATYRKDPHQTSMFRQSATGHQLDSTNQIMTSNVHCMASGAMPLASSRPNWEYQPNTSDVQTFVRSSNQPYTACVEPGYQSPNVFSSSSNQHTMSPRHTSTLPHYHEQVPTHQGYSPNKSPNALSSHEVVQRHRNEMISSPAQLHERQHLCALRIDGDERVKTPERKSQAFTVDLDTGEFKEFNSSSESTSPRSPSSTIIRSKTFRKGPEERVFEYDSKSLQSQQNKEKVYPQSSEGYPAFALQKDENTPACLVNRTSWSESAEALKAVLYNGFPKTIKDNDVIPSSGVRTSSPRRTDKKSPGARVTWITAGRNSFGGQVMLNEKGEIDESKDDGMEEDTTNPQHLALLSLHFEEKRRQIEAERQRSHEQWEEERRKIGETTFWYTIGRAQGNDKDAGKTLPRHENEPFGPGQPTPPIGRSTPFEGTSPLQTKPVYQSPIGDEYQSTLNHTTIGHGYHQTFVHRPGHQPTAQSPVIPHTGFQFPSTHSPTYPPVSSSDFHGNQHVRPEEQEYETRQFLLSEYAVQQDASSVPSSQNEPSKSPLRKCWEVNPPSATAVFAASSTEGVALHVEEAQGEDSGNQFEDLSDAHNKKGVAMFIGDETEVKQEENLQGLTPEQQRKRDRFLKNRQKKHEEEKIRRDAEHEKKRLRELKQKEIEEQKRLEDEQKREEQRRLKQTRERMATSNGETTSRPVANLPEDNSGFNEFSGPRCYVKPSGKSNRKLITNAISHVCLSGTVNKENKEKCLQAIADSPGFHFIVLFKDGLKFRGLYMLNPESEQAFKVFGIGPKIITSKMVDCVYKYSSGGKEFTKIPSKTLSISVDGVAILKTYWQSNKHNVASKTQSNLKRPPRPPQR